MVTRRTLAMAGATAIASAARRSKPIRAAVYGVGHARPMRKVEHSRKLGEFEMAGVCEPDPSVPRNHKASSTGVSIGKHARVARRWR